MFLIEAVKYFSAFNILFFFLFFSCGKHQVSHMSTTKIDSIIRVTKKKSIPTQIKILDSLLRKNYAEKEVRSKLYFELGNANFDLQNYDKAILFYKRALKNTGDEAFKGKISVNLSYAYVDKDQKDKALEYAHAASQIADKYGDDKLKRLALQALSKAYFFYGDYKKSAEMILNILELQKQKKDSAGMSASYSNLGVIYYQDKEYQKAYDITLKAYQLDKKRNDKDFLALSYNNLGAYATMLNMNSDTIISWYNKAIAIKKKKGVPYVDELINIAFVYTKDKKYDQAKKLLRRALILSKNNLSQKKTVYDYYLDLALQEKDVDRIEEYIHIRDSLSSELQKIKNEEKVRLLDQNYKLNLQKAQLENKETKLKKNIFLYTSLILILILSIIIAALAYVNRNLKFKQEKILLQHKLLSAQLNPHFIFNSLTALQNSLIRETPLRAITYLSRFAKLIRKNFDMVNKDTVSLNEELSLLKDFVEMQKIRDIHNFDFQIELDEKTEASRIHVPPLLLQPLIENAIEHGFSKINYPGRILLKIIDKGDQICFKIMDNGTGFQEKKPGKNERVHALDILKERIQLFNKDGNTDFTIKNIDQGTEVYFCIDKKN